MANQGDRDGICGLADEINLSHFNNMPRHLSKPKEDGGDWWYWKESIEREDSFTLVCMVRQELTGFLTAKIADVYTFE